MERNNNVIEQIAKDKLVEEIATNLKVDTDYFDDLVQEIYLILLTYDQEKIEGMAERGELKYFITKLITNQFYSKTSPFYKNYKKYQNKKDGNKLYEDYE